MRLFFALEPPPALCVMLENWREHNGALNGRPVPAANLHLTLAFLGEVKPRTVERLCERVDQSSQHAVFTLHLDEVGYWARQQLWWLGPSDSPSDLLQLAEMLRGLRSRFGERQGRKPFQAHVTLARRCELPPAPALQPPAFDWRCTEFSLMESRPGRRGVHYDTLATWPLQ